MSCYRSAHAFTQIKFIIPTFIRFSLSFSLFNPLFCPKLCAESINLCYCFVRVTGVTMKERERESASRAKDKKQSKRIGERKIVCKKNCSICRLVSFSLLGNEWKLLCSPYVRYECHEIGQILSFQQAGNFITGISLVQHKLFSLFGCRSTGWELFLEFWISKNVINNRKPKPFCISNK